VRNALGATAGLVGVVAFILELMKNETESADAAMDRARQLWTEGGYLSLLHSLPGIEVHALLGTRHPKVSKGVNFDFIVVSGRDGFAIFCSDGKFLEVYRDGTTNAREEPRAPLGSAFSTAKRCVREGKHELAKPPRLC
jgi:hypothetical protein